MFATVVLYVACVLGATHAQMNCAGLPDGPHGEGCRSYTCCQGEVGVQVDCPYGCVYNDLKGRCDDPANVGPPCGEVEDCSNLPDGSYPDLSTDCEWYFTCIGGIDYGKQQCAPGLVFGIGWQQCVWPDLVYEPCGILAVPTALPPEATLPDVMIPADYKLSESYRRDDEYCDNYFCPVANYTGTTPGSY